MPLPWKKTRISRISRLMADLQPTKPCNSMVVQTGFPTSLVDLFVKNCDRLKKPIKKKKKHHHRHNNNNNHQPRPVEEVVSVSEPGAGEFPADDPVNLDNDNKRKDGMDVYNKSVDRFEINHESDEGLNGGSCDTGCCNRDGRGVLYAVFMVFVVVMLALISIKILTLGITMSACVLIFLEYIGKHILCSSVRISLQLPFSLLVLRFKAPFSVFLCKEDKREVTTEAKEEFEDRIELNSPAEKIQVAEARFDVVPDNEGRVLNLISGRWGYSDMEVEEEDDDDECEVITKRHRRSSREFIKKLVPKKWRAMKKKKARKGKEETGEYAGSELSGEDKSGSNEETEELYNSECQLKEEENKISEEFATESETTLYKEEAVIKKERKRGSSFLLLVVALSGLVGGRIVALGLTVGSCVAIQLVSRRGRNQCVKKKKNKKTLSSN